MSLINFVGAVIGTKSGSKELRLLFVAGAKSNTVPFKDLGMEDNAKRVKRLGKVATLLERFTVGDLVVASFVMGVGNDKIKNIVKLEEGNSVMGGKFYVHVARKGAGINNETIQKLQAIRDGLGVAMSLPMGMIERGATDNPRCIFGMDYETAVQVAGIMDAWGAYVADESGTPVGSAPAVAIPATVVEEKAAAGFFYVPETTNIILSGAVRQLKAFGGALNQLNVMLLGDSGNGKTSLAAHLANKLGYDLTYVNCALLTEPDEIAVRRSVENGSTVTIEKEFFTKVAKGNCVVVLDEINRAYANILNGMFALLDGRGEEEFIGKKLVVGPNCIFVGTANIGAQFTGTFQADAALMNRFQVFIDVLVPPAHEEEKILVANCGVSKSDANAIVRVLTHVRTVLPESGVSVRTAKSVATLVAVGLPLRAAIETAMVNKLPVDERRPMVDAVNTKLGPMIVSKPLFDLLF